MRKKPAVSRAAFLMGALFLFLDVALRQTTGLFKQSLNLFLPFCNVLEHGNVFTDRECRSALDTAVLSCYGSLSEADTLDCKRP